MTDVAQKELGRIDVDEVLPSFEIPRRILNDLYAHAIEILPEECCGLIVGTEEDRFQRLVRCRNEMTMHHREDPVEYPRDGSEAFYMNSLDYMMVQEEAEARGARVTAVYHSHVGVGAYLSEMDLAYAASASFPFPDADHIVVAVFDRKVDSVAFFRQDGESQPFLGRTVVSSKSR
jgi:proteasome lid subunit RPN8/RPN11